MLTSKGRLHFNINLLAMRKEYVILIIMTILLTCCSVSRTEKVKNFKHIANEGFNGLIYDYSDNGNRNIKIVFNSDSTILVTNSPNIAQPYYLLAFKCVYSFKSIDISSIYIYKMLSCDKDLSKTKYLKPYDNK